jgi:hypothetical protein
MPRNAPTATTCTAAAPAPAGAAQSIRPAPPAEAGGVTVGTSPMANPSIDIRITALRVDLDRWIHLYHNPDSPPHIKALTLLSIAECQAALEQLTGEAPTIGVVEAAAHYNEVVASGRRAAGLTPQFSHMRNVSGGFQRCEPVRETELISTAEDRTLAGRRAFRTAMAQQHQHQALSLAGPRDTAPVPTTGPAFDLDNRGSVPTTARTYASGRTE